jgi:hypothetical protein
MSHDSPFPVTPLARSIQNRTVQLFDIEESDALVFATELAALAEGWGDPATTRNMDWDYRIMKHIGIRKDLIWRSEQQRMSFIQQEQQKHEAYEHFISVTRSSTPRIF